MWGGRRITASFKCNERLWKEWITHTKQFYGSVCRPMEIMIATALGISNLKVYSGLTINIQDQHISRDIRSRRKAEPIDAVAPELFPIAEEVAKWALSKYPLGLPSRRMIVRRRREGGVEQGLDRLALADWVVQRVIEQRAETGGR